MSKLSIIIPVYNVELYLEECLDSLLVQKLDDYEVIMVDDGSTDSSLMIMNKYAGKYEKFKSYTKKNSGLGHTRNYGISVSSGDYITFLDSDDIIPPSAYKTMKDTLDKTNSDFLTGNVIRFNSEKEFPSSLHQKIFSEDILETTIKNNPELINDTIACNKMYRKTFWDKHDFKFPEDMLFEDIPVTIPSHLSAKSVDVLTMYTYRWRARDFGAASITQQRSEFKNMHDRMKALNMVSEFITTENLNKEIKNQFDLKSLLLDIPIYMNVLLDGDEMFQAYFLESVKSYLENVDCELFKDLRVSNRIKYCLIQQNKKKELLDFLEYYKTLGYLEKPTLINENYYYDYRYKEYLPDELKCAEVEFEPVTRIEEVNWEKKKLNISGYLYIKELDIPKKKSVKMDFYFVDASGKEIQNITKYSKQTRRPDVTAARGIEGNYKLPLKRVYNYNWSGFKLEIDIDNIINDIVNLEQVFIKVVITIGNVVRTKQLSTSRGYKARPKYRMFNDCMIYPKYDSLSNLFLETSKVSGLVNDVQIVGNELIFTIDSNSAETDKLKIGLVNYELKNVQYANLILNNKTHITASFDVSKIKWTEDGNSFYGYIYIGQKKQPLIFDRKLIDKQIYYNQNEMFLLNHGAKGNMGIFVQKITPFMKKVELKTKKVKLVVEILKTIKAPLQSYQLIIKIGDVSKKIEPILMEHNNIINLTYYFNLEDCEKLLLDSGAARIYVEYNCEELPIKITKEGFDNLNIIVKGIKHNFYRDNNILRYRVTSNWDWIDRGPRRQDVIKKIVYPIFKKLPIKKNLTVFSAYWGTKYDCNPRALYEYIDKVSDKHKTVWFLNKQFTEVPGNAIVVKTGSIRYYYYLARANFLVNNVNFPDIYEKRKKAIEIQTMHGTPLKKIGLDSEELKFQKQKEQYINRSKRWDYLTVPSKYVAKISKSAYQSDAEILAVGYPRNDKLFNFDKKNIEQIKERIGVPKNKKIIFYAPTWRTRGVFMLPFNIKQMKEKLENEYILVVKIHHFTKLYKNEDIDSNFVFDLSDYDDIRDLYLISDMLITDYSSVMFDYATLKKPMLFYTYDYDLYKNELRGMYIDFKAEAPGPLIENTQDLLKEISIINKYEKRYKKNIQKFRKKYIMYDDGSSSRKIYENIFN